MLCPFAAGVSEASAMQTLQWTYSFFGCVLKNNSRALLTGREHFVSNGVVTYVALLALLGCL
jgi:hypothetical protein